MKFRRKHIKTDIKSVIWFRDVNETHSYDAYECKIQIKLGWFWFTIKKYWLDVPTRINNG